MDSQKFLIIVTLIDGQNFTLPDGSPEKLEAFVFAEAKFGNESYLKSDPIKLVNSNPEFVTELAWQINKRTLHQLRVERRAIKLQIFMQVKDRKKLNQPKYNTDPNSLHIDGTQSQSNASATGESNKVELIGYTIIDIRSAQETEKPKFQWLPLLNPKFRKSSYNRPEVQLALTLHKVEEDDDPNNDSMASTSLMSDSNPKTNDQEIKMNSNKNDLDSPPTSNANDTQPYRTCLDFTLDSVASENHEIIDNDIRIRSCEGTFFIYDANDSTRNSPKDCKELYHITVTIPFNSDLDTIVREPRRNGSFYFSVLLFGSHKNTEKFEELTCLDIKELRFDVMTTHLDVLATYLELNSNLTIKLHHNTGETLGMAMIQLDQLCSMDTKRRSIEGIFAIRPITDNESISSVHPSIGVSVVLERIENTLENFQVESSVCSKTYDKTKTNNQILENELVPDSEHIELAKDHFGEDLNDLFKSLNDTHQVTYDSNCQSYTNSVDEMNESCEIVTKKSEDDHHFCFTIDLKKFSYSPNQRLIPTLRELVVRYSYPFFGYQDTITTDTSIPINPNNSIIVSGFCEFNFATSYELLITALKEIPLNLDILTCDDSYQELDKLSGFKNLASTKDSCDGRLIATCSINLAQILSVDNMSIDRMELEPQSATASVPIYGLDGQEIGDLQMYLCLVDRGLPSFDFKASIDNLNELNVEQQSDERCERTFYVEQNTPTNSQKLEAFMGEAKSSFESWKEDFSKKIFETIKQRESERYKRLYQRLEAKDARREEEFKKKMDELGILERRFRKSLACVETLERTLVDSFEQIKIKDSLLESRFDNLDLKISKAVNDIKLEYDKRINSMPRTIFKPQRSLDESQLGDNHIRSSASARAPIPSKTAPDMNGPRRALKQKNGGASIPVSIRSTSLVRTNGAQAISDGVSTRFVKRPVGVVTSVVNGISSRSSRPTTSTRLSLSKETQEKLASLRKEKAELLKRGCKPNDELIQEINSLIEKLVY